MKKICYSSVSFIFIFHTDCLCTGNVKLSSTCLGATVQNNAMGEYEKVCIAENNTQVYQHTNSDINLYLYYVTSLEVFFLSYYFLINSQITYFENRCHFEFFL